MLEMFTVVFLASILLAIKPGPHLMMMLSLAFQGRWKSMGYFYLGTFVSDSISYTLLLKGLSFIPEDFGFVFIFIKATAAIMFVSMGLTSLAQNLDTIKKEGKEDAKKVENRSRWSVFWSGAILTISNPLNIIFILTAIPAITGLEYFTFLHIALIIIALFGSDMLIVALYCIPIVMFRKKASDTWLNRINVVASGIMILIGLYIFASVLTQWDLNMTQLL